MATLPHEGTYPVMYAPLSVSVGSGYRNGYLARPDRAGRFPTVVLVPDLGGLTSTEKDLARRLARWGLATLVVEIMTRRGSADPLIDYSGSDDNDGIRVLDETHDYLCSDDIDWSLTETIGVLGLAVGGRFALLLAAHRPWVGAAAVVGTPMTGDEERRFQVANILDHVAPPVLGLYGATDDLIDASTVDEAQRRNANGTWLLYEGVGHGFLDLNADGYDQAAADDAMNRVVEFFTTNLPAAAPVVVG